MVPAHGFRPIFPRDSVRLGISGRGGITAADSSALTRQAKEESSLHRVEKQNICPVPLLTSCESVRSRTQRTAWVPLLRAQCGHCRHGDVLNNNTTLHVNGRGSFLPEEVIL